MGPLTLVEAAVKKPVFGCKLCGQCVLHSTGMTCPMTCPKQLRNGPCGGVRPDGPGFAAFTSEVEAILGPGGDGTCWERCTRAFMALPDAGASVPPRSRISVTPAV